MATKGWSFGALTDALKSAAFLNAGSQSGQVPVIDSGTQRVTVAAGAGSQLSGFQAQGIEQNDVFLISFANRPVFGYTGSVQFNWYSNQVSFGLARGSGTDAIGYAFAFNGNPRYVFDNNSNSHKFFGNVYSLSDIVIGRAATTSGFNVTTSDLFRISAVNATNFTLAHTSRTWSFGNDGSITPVGTLGGDSATGAIVCTPTPGSSWDSWNARSSGLQINLTGTNVSTGVKFTLWGTSEVASIQGAYSGGRAILRLSSASGPYMSIGADSGNNAFIFSGGGINVGGNIVASGAVLLNGGTGQMTTDGNLYGSVWGNQYLSAWLNNSINILNSGLNERLNDVRWANERRANAGGRHQPITGLDGNGDNAVTSDLQGYRASAGGWYTFGWV